jgi:hypothetical protein
MAREVSSSQSVQGILLVLLHARVSRLEERLEAGPGGLRDKNVEHRIEETLQAGPSGLRDKNVKHRIEETLQAGPSGLRDKNVNRKISDHDNASVTPTDESILSAESISQSAERFVDEQAAREKLVSAFHSGQVKDQDVESV